jgi:hypothetical protein
MTESYIKVNDLLEKNDVEEAAQEFREGFATQVKKLYSESSDTPPERYKDDCNWNAKIKELYVTTNKTQTALAKGDATSSGAGVGAIREFFFKLHTDNKMKLTNDAIYAFRREVDKLAEKKALAGSDLGTLKKLKSAISDAKPSMRTKADGDSFRKNFQDWSARVDSLLAQSSLGPEQSDELKELSVSFYKKYGMDLE